MENKLYIWCLAFIALLIVHGGQAARKNVRNPSYGDGDGISADGRQQLIAEDWPPVGSGSGDSDGTETDYYNYGDESEGSADEVPDDVPPTTLTLCQEQRNSKQSSNFRGYRPQCTESGAFEPVQCYDLTKECWCVDSEGNQVGEQYRDPEVPICPPPYQGGRRPNVGLPPSRSETDDIFMVDPTIRPRADAKTPKSARDEHRDNNPDMEPLPPRNLFEYILYHPLILAAVIGGCILVLVVIILMLMFCIYRMRKKDEGSYSLDEPRQTFNYTRAKDQEFFA